jgi:hypothetical protein
MRRMILSEIGSDEKIFLFFSRLGNSIPNLVRLSGHRRVHFRSVPSTSLLAYSGFPVASGDDLLVTLALSDSHGC